MSLEDYLQISFMKALFPPINIGNRETLLNMLCACYMRLLMFSWAKERNPELGCSGI